MDSGRTTGFLHLHLPGSLGEFRAIRALSGVSVFIRSHTASRKLWQASCWKLCLRRLCRMYRNHSSQKIFFGCKNVDCLISGSHIFFEKNMHRLQFFSYTKIIIIEFSSCEIKRSIWEGEREYAYSPAPDHSQNVQRAKCRAESWNYNPDLQPNDRDLSTWAVMAAIQNCIA